MKPRWPLDIVVVGITHERYEQQLCKTGHNFHVIKTDRDWDRSYGKIPTNYIIRGEVPTYVNPDLVLCHLSGNRLDIANNIQRFYNIPVIRHTHTLPESQGEMEVFHSQRADVNTFISNYSMKCWETNGVVINHGLDTNFWKQNSSITRKPTVLSVVNLWADRDWACGWRLYNDIKKLLPNVEFKVLGKNPGLSKPAKSIEHLRDELSQCSVFLNTSLHSPIPMSVLEAASCSCAIVSTDTCMIPEIFTHGKNCLFAKTSEEFAHSISLLLHSPQKMVELGDNARNVICEDFNIDNFITNWNEVFYNAVSVN